MEEVSKNEKHNTKVMKTQRNVSMASMAKNHFQVMRQPMPAYLPDVL